MGQTFIRPSREDIFRIHLYWTVGIWCVRILLILALCACFCRSKSTPPAPLPLQVPAGTAQAAHQPVPVVGKLVKEAFAPNAEHRIDIPDVSDRPRRGFASSF